MSIARIQNLTVRYGSFTAVRNMTGEIPEGCTGLLGPNGAGKTTFLKTVMGFVKPAEGSVQVLGLDVTTQGPEIRQRVGLMPEQDCHIPGMTAVQYVAYAGELAGMPPEEALRRSHEVLEYCGLGEARYRNVETYSTGMKQRVKFAQALIHGPKLLLLDEPTNGLDPAGREEMLDLVQSVSHGKGLNVLVSSHLLPDIERVCDNVMVVMAGEIVLAGSIKQIKQIEGLPVDVELREPSPGFVAELGRRGIPCSPPKGNVYRLQPSGDLIHAHREIQEAARAAGAQVRGFGAAERSLEEAFLNVVQSGDRR